MNVLKFCCKVEKQNKKEESQLHFTQTRSPQYQRFQRDLCNRVERALKKKKKKSFFSGIFIPARSGCGGRRSRAPSTSLPYPVWDPHTYGGSRAPKHSHMGAKQPSKRPNHPGVPRMPMQAPSVVAARAPWCLGLSQCPARCHSLGLTCTPRSPAGRGAPPTWASQLEVLHVGSPEACSVSARAAGLDPGRCRGTCRSFAGVARGGQPLAGLS